MDQSEKQVRCVNDAGCPQVLTKGRAYTARPSQDGPEYYDILSECGPAITWLRSRFEDVTPDPGTLSTAVPTLAGDAAARKQLPMFNGLIGFFPNACAAVANVSLRATQQHHPNESMHWDFTKSIGTGDDILRHLSERGTFDTDGLRHTAKAAWRALELLERELLAAHPELKPGVNVKGFSR